MLPNASTRLAATCYTVRAMGRANNEFTFLRHLLPICSKRDGYWLEGSPGARPATEVQAGEHARGGALKTWPRLALPLLAMLALACESGGVGDPCIPEDEFFPEFSGFDLGEVNVESRSFQCETRVCLVNKFQGRVSCPYGTRGTPPVPDATTVDHNYPCEVPGFGGYVTVPVYPQLTERRPEVAVYCSCRCAGADPNARYCECPSGFECAEIVADRGQGQSELAGSYCIRRGSDIDPNRLDSRECSVPPAGSPPGPDDLTCGNAPALATTSG